METKVLTVGKLAITCVYNGEQADLEAATSDVQAARDDLNQLVGSVVDSIPQITAWQRPVVKATVATALRWLLPRQVTTTTERAFGQYVSVRVTPQVVQVSFRVTPEQFERHLLRYEG